MKANAARIAYRGGRLIVPATDVYEQQLMIEQLERIAELYGEALLMFNGLVARVQRHTLHTPSVCAECAKPVRLAVCMLGSRTLCVSCLQSVAAAPAGERAQRPARRRPALRPVAAGRERRA